MDSLLSLAFYVSCGGLACCAAEAICFHTPQATTVGVYFFVLAITTSVLRSYSKHKEEGP